LAYLAAKTEFDISYEKFVAFKAQSNNSYFYVANRSYAFFGDRTETKITVKNGKVVKREYTMWTNPNATGTVVKETWIEKDDSLNTHENTRADEALTLDQVYAKAKSTWLNVDKKENEVYFDAKNDGLISSAGYSAKGCQDDCFNGIHIKEVSAL
jgi:hypothetical protein